MDLVSGEILLIDKPLGWTSFDAVKRLRGAILRRLHVRKFKVGHAGTLDPLATGLLLVCTGRATRRIEELQQGEKEYVATLRLGATTPSFDLEREIDATYPTDHLTDTLVDEALEQFRGDIMQVPPVFSAVKVDGRRAYKYAHKGRADEIELQAKPIRISELERLPAELPELRLRIVCSKGTYIRALARDIGQALGCGAHLTSLRRTRVGSARIADALTVDQAVNLIAEAPLTFPDDYQGPATDSGLTSLNS